MAKIYRCSYQEVSASMGLHMDDLLKSLIFQVQTALKSYRDQSQESLDLSGMAENSEFARRPSLIRRIQLRGRRLVKSCEELFSKMKI